ncbi:MAG: DUF559 domain-containing protein [Alphaproteobacteria bacterium]|nr:DUF559 domain-containing protein [Alphaproteobacteria bacterium]
MTDAEMRLWFRLRPLRKEGFSFRRQSPVGRYIADFECRTVKLIIELDGSQHAKREHAQRDLERDAWLRFRGYQVLRFWNDDVLLRTDAVMDVIFETARLRLDLRDKV